jgi:hypothetical protein
MKLIVTESSNHRADVGDMAICIGVYTADKTLKVLTHFLVTLQAPPIILVVCLMSKQTILQVLTASENRLR